MRISLFTASLLASTVVAVPAVEIDKRYYTTEIVYETKTVFVSATPDGGHNWGSWPATWGRPSVIPISASASSSSSATSTVTSTTAEVTTSSSSTSETPSSASTSTTSSSAPASTSQVSGLSDWQNMILDHHNIHRRNHSSADLVWNTTLANYAQTIGETCDYKHQTAPGTTGYGQNIGAGAPPEQVDAMLTNEMYNDEFGWYPQPWGKNDNLDDSNFEKWGHFSQIVWKNTASVGCATVHCANGLAEVGNNVAPYFTVCNYYPPGNSGNYGLNVQAPLGQPVMTVASGQ